MVNMLHLCKRSTSRCSQCHEFFVNTVETHNNPINRYGISNFKSCFGELLEDSSKFDFQNQQSQNYTICSTLLIRVMSFFLLPLKYCEIYIYRKKSPFTERDFTFLNHRWCKFTEAIDRTFNRFTGINNSRRMSEEHEKVCHSLAFGSCSPNIPNGLLRR